MNPEEKFTVRLTAEQIHHIEYLLVAEDANTIPDDRLSDEDFEKQARYNDHNHAVWMALVADLPPSLGLIGTKPIFEDDGIDALLDDLLNNKED